MTLQPKTILFAFFIVGSVFFSCQQASTQTRGMQEEIINDSKEEESLLRHVVIFKFKDGASEEDVKKLNDAFIALPEAIPVVKDFEWGINNSPEGLDQDFTHCYMLTFASEEDRDSIYAPHPQHQAFVESLQPHLEKVFVVDYWTNP